MMKRILVTGSRHLTDRLLVYRALNVQLVEWFGWPTDEDPMPWLGKVVLVHGDCPTGADAIADDWCVSNFIEPERHPAKWSEFGKAAGPLRNQEMVDLGADVCYAFPLPDSRGTYDCMRKAQAAGIPVMEIVG